MPVSSRAAWVLGFGLLTIAGLVGRSIGQDRNVQRASTQGAATTLPPAVVGSIDMDAVFKGYEKVDFIRKQIESQAELKKAELGKLIAELQQISKEMENLQPGSPDYKNHDEKLTRLKVQLDAEREQAQKEFALKEAEALATIYKEIQAMVEAVAKHNHMTYVIRISNEPVSGADPNSALAAMSRSVVYSDPSTDITQVVVRTLNARYKPTAAPRPAPAPASNAPATGSR